MGQAIMLPLYFISGVFVPNASLPGWLRHLASIFPVQHLADGLHHAYDPAARGTGVGAKSRTVRRVASSSANARLRREWRPRGRACGEARPATDHHRRHGAHSRAPQSDRRAR